MSKKKKTPSKQQKAGHLTLLGSGTTEYPDKPAAGILETFPNAFPNRDYLVKFTCPEFTSICPVTGQPDFGTITIEYMPDESCIESKSLKLYLGAYRNQGAFAESIVNQVLEDLVGACQPLSMVVTGDFTARGGITINVSAVYKLEEDEDFLNLLDDLDETDFPPDEED